VNPVLEVQHLGFSYGRTTVITDVSLAVLPGEIVALIGPNGAGKTTLLKVLAGLLSPTAGNVKTVGPRPETIAYLAQVEELPVDWSVREVVELGRFPYVGLWRDLAQRDDEVVRDSMERTSVAPLAARLVGTLSGGERQRVALARALAQEPRALLLDEPTTHLDLRHQAHLFAALRAEAARGVGVVTVMHDLAFAGQADRCVLLSNGSVRATGSPAEVLRADLLEQAYGTRVEVFQAADGRIVVVPASGGEKATWKTVASS
jgi:ABC-type cobalamin/Fe3+-siderophores transport system ATPase subunit